MAEGFGLTAAEAMACGTPTVVTNFGAQAEVVGNAAWKVEGEPYYIEGHNGDWKIPYIGDIKAYERAYPRGAAWQAKRAAGPKHIAEHYDAKVVLVEDHWIPTLRGSWSRSCRRLAGHDRVAEQ